MKHKWHKEIKAWADGAEIEYNQSQFGEWTLMRHGLAMFDDDSFQFRIKTQPKQPKYLYAYYRDKVYFLQDKDASNRYYIGKIEVNDD